MIAAIGFATAAVLAILAGVFGVVALGQFIWGKIGRPCR